MHFIIIRHNGVEPATKGHDEFSKMGKSYEGDASPGQMGLIVFFDRNCNKCDVRIGVKHTNLS